MDIFEKAIKICFPSLSNTCLINTDAFIQPVAKQIMALRLSETPLNSDPIVLYGFRPLAQVLRSEKEHARLILGPRIYHLQLPAGIDVVQRLSNRIERESVDKNRFLAEFKESSFADAGLSRMESAIAHGRGNFLGCEKLLYGAYLGGAVDAEGFRKRLNEIRAAQQSAFALDSMDYQHYRLLQVDYEPKEHLAQTSFEPFQGKILYIDDHAHLGWSIAIATALWGNYNKKIDDDCNSADVPAIDSYSATKGEDRLDSIRIKAIKDKDNEDSYLDRVLAFIEKSALLKAYDVILLDLRLRFTEDETADDRDIEDETADDRDKKKLSGIRVLSKIRKQLPGIPIVVLTASRKAKNMQKVLELGADHYFIKEIPQPGEKRESIFQYWHEFRKTLGSAVSISFLSEAWEVIKELRKKKPEKYLVGGVGYDSLAEEQKLDWQQDVVSPIIKGFGLLRRKPNEFDKKVYGLDWMSEAIMNFNLANDAIDMANKKSKPGVYDYIAPNFKAWALLFGLRSLGVHKTGVSLKLEDCKIALYLSYRLFLEPNKLDGLAKRMFGDATISRDDLNQDFFQKVNRPLLERVGINDGNPSITIGKWSINIMENKVIIKFPNNEYRAVQPYLPLKLLEPITISPFFHIFRSKKKYHYLMFLSRLSHPEIRDNIQGADWNLVSAIYRRLFTV